MEWTITKEHDGMLIRDYLIQVKGFSRRIIKAVKFQGGSILVNGKFCTVRYQLADGDLLQVILPLENRGAFMEPESIPLNIVYEDDDVLVIDKPAGVATIPSIHHTSGTIANGILGYYEDNEVSYTVHIVTRLDRDTSGLLLVAKHRFSHSILSKDQKQGLVNRKYYAIIEGRLTEKQGTINAPIGRKDDSIIERVVRVDGQQAITHYQVAKEVGDYSLVEVKLETGRTHQIRVHFSSIGYPLIGDSMYGGKVVAIDRQALHCKALAFYHPIKKERLTFESQLPEDMAKVINE